MFGNVLIIDVEEKDGLIFFNKDENILNLIKTSSDVELGFFNDFDNLNDICKYVSEGSYGTLILKFDVSLGLFAKTLTNMLIDTDVKIIWLIENSNYSFHSVNEKNIKIFNSFKDLNLYLSNQKINMENIKEAELKKYFLNNKKHTEIYRRIMTNGYIAYVTGIYPQGFVCFNAKHIHVNKNVNLDKILNSVDINLNSAFFVDAEAYNSNLYKKLKLTKGLISHIHQINKDRVYFDNSKYSVKKYDCSLKEYIELCKLNKVDKNELYIVHINDNQDISALKEILEQFKNTGKILNPNFYLADECRWIGRCDLNKFRRMNIIDENIIPCNTSKTCLYSINDDKFVRLAKINKERGKVQVNNCSKCTYSNICSKCICLPERVMRESFCKIINEFPYIREFFKKRNFMSFLLKSGKFFKENRIRISSQIHPIVYIKSSNKCDTSRIIYLFSYENKFYVYNFKNNKIIKIDEKLAFILEAYSINDEKSNIIDNYKMKYNVNEKCASNIVNTSITSLIKPGF